VIVGTVCQTIQRESMILRKNLTKPRQHQNYNRPRIARVAKFELEAVSPQAQLKIKSKFIAVSYSVLLLLSDRLFSSCIFGGWVNRIIFEAGCFRGQADALSLEPAYPREQIRLP